LKRKHRFHENEEARVASSFGNPRTLADITNQHGGAVAHPFDIISPSPDAQHIAHFAYSGDIRFGPPYFSLSVDDYSFGQRIFGDAHLWSASSKLLAVQEWLTLDYSEGPITSLALIDLQSGREVTVKQVVKAFLVPVALEDSKIIFRKDYVGNEGTQRFEVDIAKLTEWSEMA
jgi:hypothetical protein